MRLLRLFALGLLGGAVLIPCSLHGQDAQTPNKGKKTSKEEIEAPAKPLRKVIHVGDEETESPKAELGAAGLEREARTAKTAAQRDLFAALAHPYDLLLMARGRKERVEMIPAYVGLPPRFEGKLTLHPFNDDWQPSKNALTVAAQDLSAITPYEILAIQEVDAFLRQQPTTAAGLSRGEAYESAIKALTSVLRSHMEARERGTRQGTEWKAVEKKLQSKLQEVRLGYLDALSDGKQWELAWALAVQLADDDRKNSDMQQQIARMLAKQVGHALDQNDYGEARRRLQLLSQRFSQSKEFEAVRQQLRARAQAIVDEARKLEKDGKSEEALARLQVAETIDAQLPGLHDYSLRLAREYPILTVGVRELPTEMSPARAITDADKQAVELQFEGLVRLISGPVQGDCYRPQLAAEMPSMIPLGRQFQLLRTAYWSNGQQITATDVRHTVRMLSDRRWPRHVPAWADLLEDGATIGDDAFHISLALRQGFIEPLALMDFKVLPESLAKADDPAFSKTPIGSGPFVFKGIERETAVFVANPYYQQRSNTETLPHIREIRLVRSSTPVADLQAGRLQLLLDLPTQRYRELEAAASPNVRLQTERNRRVFFLAANHRRPHLQSLALRRAIAHGIDREDILNKVFRAGNAMRHKALNGPFPADSWPVQPTLPKAFNPELARAQGEKAKDEGATIGRLTLRYPQDDPAVEQACQAIRQQLLTLNLGIDLVLLPRTSGELYRDVVIEHDYDLAYYSWDYPDEVYWLLPLLDARATGPAGGNFLGYQNDEVLQSLLRRVQTHREFPVVQDLMRQVHELFFEKMPIIPLWQLDTHLALHTSLLIPGDIDPLKIFTGVEAWTLVRR